MLKFIRGLFESKPKIKIAHPILGELQLEQGAKSPYWLREAYHDGELTFCVDTVGEDLPSDAQAKFFLWVTESLESIYQEVASDLAVQHQGMQRKPVNANWRQTFRLASFDVPLEGDKRLPWELTFECLTDNSGNLYTCHFENGSLAHVSVDT
ncbi:MAG TPA: hypothetical protein VFP33_04955 [Gallionella sp.]|nr:hypothetical protein [Gallionella sp.]